MIDVGDHVAVKVTGKIAKKENGHVIRGEWTTFKDGDIGRVIGKRKVDDRMRYKVLVNDGVVELAYRDIETMMDEDIRIPKSALVNSDIRRTVSNTDQDLSDNADY